MDGPMTPEEKAMVMQFMGQTYGAVHQQDQNIVGNSGNLTPKSQELKNMFEQTARMPTVDPNTFVPTLVINLGIIYLNFSPAV